MENTMSSPAAKRWEIHRGDAAYPPTLEDLESPPELLYGLGNPEALLGPCISVVGARKATPYGLAVAEMVGRIAAECGITVVSGGAMGCDCAAGDAALKAGGYTIVVSGCGADVVYPSSSAAVFEGAKSGGGAIISMEPWGAGPRRWTFPKRNVVIAALSQVLVVTEAGTKSGTMSTAEAAIELDRVVYAIPGSIFSPTSSGTNGLIAEGARIIPDESSLELALALDYGVARFSEQGERDRMGPVMSALLASPSRPEELAERLNENVLTILKTLTDYEARGLAVRLPDGRWSPSQSYLVHREGAQKHGSK